MFKKEKS